MRASISSAVDSPRPSIIDFEVNAAISPEKFEIAGDYCGVTFTVKPGEAHIPHKIA